MNTKKCLHCGETIPLMTRADRKYCPEKYGKKEFCKNAVTNIKNKLNYRLVKQTNKNLLNNREILFHLLGKENLKTVTYNDLNQQGFQLKFVSEIGKTHAGDTVYHYLDHCLIFLKNGEIKLQING